MAEGVHSLPPGKIFNFFLKFWKKERSPCNEIFYSQTNCALPGLRFCLAWDFSLAVGLILRSTYYLFQCVVVFLGVDDDNIGVYDVDNFVARFVKIVQQTPRASLCHIQHKPILLQNYFGLLSIIHNRNGLGFFKIRGKFSF